MIAVKRLLIGPVVATTGSVLVSGPFGPLRLVSGKELAGVRHLNFPCRIDGDNAKAHSLSFDQGIAGQRFGSGDSGENFSLSVRGINKPVAINIFDRHGDDRINGAVCGMRG